MQIVAVCPFCQTSYQVQPALQGQAIRCPNAVCRRVFTVAPEAPPGTEKPTPRGPKDKPDNGSHSGSVGDFVPLLPAEPVAPPSETKATEGNWWQNPPPPPSEETPTQAAWWRDAPPPARKPRSKQTPTPTTKKPPSSPPPREQPTVLQPPPPPPATREQPTVLQPPEQPRELPPGQWQPPPVRRDSASTAKDDPRPEPQSPTEESPPEQTHQPRLGKRRAHWLVAAILVGSVVIVVGAGALAWSVVHKSEEQRFAEAMSEYKQGKYGSAASQFHELAERFPNSERASEYRFLQEWSDVCGVAAVPGDDLDTAASKLGVFIKNNKNDPLMGQFGHDAVSLLLRLAKTFAERNAAPTNEKPLQTADAIEQLSRTVAGINSDALTNTDDAQVQSDLGKVRTAVARWRQRRDVLAQLSRRPNEKPFDAIQRVNSLLERKKRDLPGLNDDAEVRTAVNRLYESHLAGVVYQPVGKGDPLDVPPHPDDDSRSLMLPPLSPIDDNDSVVLALARGVLYALKQSNGELKWAMRVGIDTTELPLRVPRRQASPELFLVLSADARTLTALDAKGEIRWEYAIGQPVLGQPVVIERRAYLAAYDGTVHEIELSGGQLIGRYFLGQRLTRGGAREGDSKRIYFPADDSCVYVLDVERHRCDLILYDGHRSGSLRSEPIVVPPERLGGNQTPGYLILNQVSGLDAMRLHVFQLPLRDRHAVPLTLNPAARLSGWTWFKPYHDGEKMAVLSDAGILGLFGICQPGNRDQALFPLLKPDGLDLSSFLGGGSEAPHERGRAQVVQMQGDDLWVLARGRLQQIRLMWASDVGPKAVAGWSKALALGSPLHAPQILEDRDGRSTFVLVTRPLTKQTCLASAISDSGRVLWQRQLGLVCQGEPLTLTPPKGGSPKLLALDQSGGLFVLDPSATSETAQASWNRLAAALDDNPRQPPRLVASADGQSAYEIAVPGDGKTLIVRRIDWNEDGQSLRCLSQRAPLSMSGGKAALAGTPAILGNQLIVPTTERELARLPLSFKEEETSFEMGPTGRDNRAALNAPCHVLALGGDRFLANDGRSGLSVFEWPIDKGWQRLPKGSDRPYSLPQRVAAPPVLLPAKKGQLPSLVVADSTGVVHLLRVSEDGSLKEVRTWQLQDGQVSALFVYRLADSVRVGCLSDRRQLVWLDPSQKEPQWSYQTQDEIIVGRPQIIEGMLVLALQSGRYLALDPADGKAKGTGYTLRASAAPASSAVPFGHGLLLAPLSDGTCLLLSCDKLRSSKH